MGTPRDPVAVDVSKYGWHTTAVWAYAKPGEYANLLSVEVAIR